MDNQEILKAIAVLADKVSRYHERLLAVERDHTKHVKGCTCQEPPKEIAKGPDYPTVGRPLTEDERMFVQGNMEKHKKASRES